MAMDNATIYEQNVQQIVDFIMSGCKKDQGLGVEFENILVKKDTYAPVSYGEEQGVREILERLSAYYPHKVYEGINLLGLSTDDASITLEPAACLEYSAGPYHTVGEVEASFLDFRSKLEPVLDEFGLTMAELGYHPSARARDLELIPKKRYYSMNRYLRGFGRFGACMMRCSAALQVSIDFTSEEDALKKLRVANALAPLFALLTDNSPIFEGRPVKQHMIRTLIWNNYDTNRCMVIPGTFDEDFSFRKYAEFIMNTAAIVVPDKNEGWRYVGEETFADVYSDRVMDVIETEHALSMVFPDGRLKRFLEIRPADALPTAYAMGYVALIKGLFYDQRNLDQLTVDIANVTESSIQHGKREMMKDGYDAYLGDRDPVDWLTSLLDMAERALDEEEARYLAPLRELVNSRETLAERYTGIYPPYKKIPRIGVFPRYNMEHTQLSVGLGYINGILEAGGIPLILPSTDDPTLLESIVEGYDGFLIPGGHDVDPKNYGQKRSDELHDCCIERDTMELSIVPMIVDADKPLLGICRGQQVINVALGGTLTQDLSRAMPEALDHVQEQPYADAVHLVDIAPRSQLAEILQVRRTPVNSIHHQAIDTLAEDLVVNARSEDGIIEGVEIPDKRFIIGVQWHPEYLWPHDFIHRRLFKALVREAAESE